MQTEFIDDGLERKIIFIIKNIFFYNFALRKLIKKYILIFLILIILIISLIYYPCLDSLDKLINKLKRKINARKPEYIIFLDYIHSNVCSDENAYLIFQYFQKKNY